MFGEEYNECSSALCNFLHLYHKIKISELNKNETLTTQEYKYTAFLYTPKDPRRDMTKDVKASLNNNE